MKIEGGRSAVQSSQQALPVAAPKLGFNGELHEPFGRQILGSYRVFNPVLMRFHSPDSLSPFGDGGINAYAYCNNDPVNNADPSGRISIRGTARLALHFMKIERALREIADSKRPLRVSRPSPNKHGNYVDPNENPRFIKVKHGSIQDPATLLFELRYRKGIYEAAGRGRTMASSGGLKFGPHMAKGQPSLSEREDVLYAGTLELSRTHKLMGGDSGSGHYRPDQNLYVSNIPPWLRQTLPSSKFRKYERPVLRPRDIRMGYTDPAV